MKIALATFTPLTGRGGWGAFHWQSNRTGRTHLGAVALASASGAADLRPVLSR